MRRYLRTVLLTSVVVGAAVARPAPEIAPGRDATLDEYKSRFEAALEKHGLNKTGTYAPADEDRVALEIVMCIETGQHEETRIQGTVVPATTVVDGLERLTGTRITDTEQRQSILALFQERKQEQRQIAERVCTIANDPRLSDEEFIAASRQAQVTTVSARAFYERLESLVPNATLLALRERATEFSYMMVEDPKLDAWEAFTRELVDVLRPNHARGCNASFTTTIPGGALDGLLP